MAKECSNAQQLPSSAAAQDPPASSSRSGLINHENNLPTTNNNQCHYTLNDYLSIESALSLISARYGSSILSLDDVYSLIPSASSSSDLLLMLLDIGGSELYKLSFCHPDGKKEGVYLELTTTADRRMEILRRKYQEQAHNNIIMSDDAAALNKSGSSSRSSKNKALIDCHRKTTTKDGNINKTSMTTTTTTTKTTKTTKKSKIAALFECSAPFNAVAGDEATTTKTATTGGNTIKSSSSFHPYENMTLVERVHARARDAEKKRNESSSLRRRSSSSSSPRNDEFSRLELLRLADALRSRVRLKQSRVWAFQGGGTSSSQQQPKSTISIKEFIRYFKGVFTGNDVVDSKVKSKRALRCLLALMEAVPEWISIERARVVAAGGDNNGGGPSDDGDDDEPKSGKPLLRGLSKDSIVVISNDVDYHSSVRVKLGGRINKNKQQKEGKLKQLSQPATISLKDHEQNILQTTLEQDNKLTTTATKQQQQQQQHPRQKSIQHPGTEANNGPAQVSLSPTSTTSQKAAADQTTTTTNSTVVLPPSMPPPPSRQRKRKHMLSLTKQRQEQQQQQQQQQLSQKISALRKKEGDDDETSNDRNERNGGNNNNLEPPTKRTRMMSQKRESSSTNSQSSPPQSRPPPTKIIPGSTKTMVAPVVYPARQTTTTTTTTTTTNHQSKKRKKSRVESPSSSLRVNKNFMFGSNDSSGYNDYDDGERINLLGTSFDSSPRGLKRLFKKMSQGERI